MPRSRTTPLIFSTSQTRSWDMDTMPINTNYPHDSGSDQVPLQQMFDAFPISPLNELL